ncbi:MAG: hypothetical protein U0936_15700 [Planctomycetaceae bacterium]
MADPSQHITVAAEVLGQACDHNVRKKCSTFWLMQAARGYR